jgi:hypothetical protein
VSTLTEIQDAITRLEPEERNALAVWLQSQESPVIPPQEEERLLRSIDEALEEIDAGKGVSSDEVRQMIRSWVAK